MHLNVINVPSPITTESGLFCICCLSWKWFVIFAVLLALPRFLWQPGRGQAAEGAKYVYGLGTFPAIRPFTNVDVQQSVTTKNGMKYIQGSLVIFYFLVLSTMGFITIQPPFWRICFTRSRHLDANPSEITHFCLGIKLDANLWYLWGISNGFHLEKGIVWLGKINMTTPAI